jgi:hypothetical protein
MLATTALATSATFLPNLTQADQPQPSLFRNSTAVQARPIRQDANSTDARWADVRKRRIGASSSTLRWQTPKAVGITLHRAEPSPSTAQPVAHVEPVAEKPKHVANKVFAWGQDDMNAKGTRIRLVTQLGPIDPFDDPFGDRQVQFSAPSNGAFVSQPEAEPLPDIGPVPVAPPNAPRPATSEDDIAPLPQFSERDEPVVPFLQDDAPRPPIIDAPQPPANDTPPATNDRGFREPVIPPAQPYTPSADCDKIYNERNCCDEGEQCQNARRRVGANTIDKISLNISPSFKPDATTEAEVEQSRTLRLAQSSIRSWRNRDGEVVARGQVTNLKFGRVYIEDEGKVAKIPVGQLSDDDWCFLASWWGVPTECSLGDDKFASREWIASTMTWKASGLCHKPLYFEEVQLERYGHTSGPLSQPILSGAHFFLNIATLPYQMGISPPNECEYALGYYRPGNCAPWLLPPVPLSVRGALMEAAVVTGGAFVFP